MYTKFHWATHNRRAKNNRGNVSREEGGAATGAKHTLDSENAIPKLKGSWRCRLRETSLIGAQEDHYNHLRMIPPLQYPKNEVENQPGREQLRQPRWDSQKI